MVFNRVFLLLNGVFIDPFCPFVNFIGKCQRKDKDFIGKDIFIGGHRIASFDRYLLYHFFLHCFLHLFIIATPFIDFILKILTFRDLLDGPFIHLLAHHKLQNGDKSDDCSDHNNRMDFRVLNELILIVAVFVVKVRFVRVLKMQVILESHFLVCKGLIGLID